MSNEGDVGSGITNQFVGTVTVAATAIPASPNKSIKDWIVKCASNQPATARLMYSLDGGTTYATLSRGDAEWGQFLTPRTQLFIKAAVGTVDYEITLNRI